MLTAKRTLQALAVPAIALSVGLASAPAQSQETFELQIQSLWQAGSINQNVFERFTNQVTEASDGQLKLIPLPVNSIVAHNETLDAVGSGVLDGQHTAPVYFSGRDPAFALLGDLNAGYENPYQMTQWFYNHGGLKLARELYKQHNIFYIGPVFWGMESIPTKRKVASVEDMKGLKIRAPEGPVSDLMSKLGASPVNIAGADVYTSLERGVIDATDWGTLSMHEDLGFDEIAKYHIYPGFHSMPGAEVAINLDTWNELPKHLKTLLKVAVRSFNLDMIQTIAAADLEAEQEVVKEGGELVEWSDEERKKVRQVAQEVWKKYAGRSELAQKIYESHVAYLKKLGLIE